MLGVGGKHLSDIPPPEPVTTANVITFVTTTASFMIALCIMTADYGVYHDASASSYRVFFYAYLGLFLGTASTQCVGAVFAASASRVALWETGFEDGDNPGGLMRTILRATGGFGDFLTVLVALTIPSICAPAMYTFGTSFMTMGSWFSKIPRYVYMIVSEAIVIPVAIVGAKTFYATFVDILNIIGYWSTVYAVIIAAEHVIFRRNSWSNYTVEDWNIPSKLPLGMAAVMSFLCSCGIIVPSMSQVWYTGPIAKTGSGDVGILTGSAVALLTYSIFRAVEKRLSGR